MCIDAASKSKVLSLRNIQVRFAYLKNLLKSSNKVFGPPTVEFRVIGGDGMNVFRPPNRFIAFKKTYPALTSTTPLSISEMLSRRFLFFFFLSFHRLACLHKNQASFQHVLFGSRLKLDAARATFLQRG